MRAMTWWDHETESIWSQPWGTAIKGELKGTRLALVPASLEPAESWLGRHGDSLVMVEDDPSRDGLYEPVGRIDFFVIGVTSGDHATAFRYSDAAARGVINDTVGSTPIAVFVVAETGQIGVFSADGAWETPLTFSFTGGRFVDDQTGSAWDPLTGRSTGGALSGRELKRVAFISSYDWAWEDFFPHSRFHVPDGQ